MQGGRLGSASVNTFLVRLGVRVLLCHLLTSGLGSMTSDFVVRPPVGSSGKNRVLPWHAVSLHRSSPRPFGLAAMAPCSLPAISHWIRSLSMPLHSVVNLHCATPIHLSLPADGPPATPPSFDSSCPPSAFSVDTVKVTGHWPSILAAVLGSTPSKSRPEPSCSLPLLLLFLERLPSSRRSSASRLLMISLLLVRVDAVALDAKGLLANRKALTCKRCRVCGLRWLACGGFRMAGQGEEKGCGLKPRRP